MVGCCVCGMHMFVVFSFAKVLGWRHDDEEASWLKRGLYQTRCWLACHFLDEVVCVAAKPWCRPQVMTVDLLMLRSFSIDPYHSYCSEGRDRGGRCSVFLIRCDALYSRPIPSRYCHLVHRIASLRAVEFGLALGGKRVRVLLWTSVV